MDEREQADWTRAEELIASVLRDNRWQNDLTSVTYGYGLAVTRPEFVRQKLHGDGPTFPACVIIRRSPQGRQPITFWREGEDARYLRELTYETLLIALLWTFPDLDDLAEKVTSELQIVLHPSAEVRVFAPDPLAVQVHIRSAVFDGLHVFSRYRLLYSTFDKLTRRSALSEGQRWRISQVFGYARGDDLPEEPVGKWVGASRPHWPHASPWPLLKPGPCMLSQAGEGLCICGVPAECPRLLPGHMTPMLTPSATTATPRTEPVEVSAEPEDSTPDLQQDGHAIVELLLHKIHGDSRVRAVLDAFAASVLHELREKP